MHTILLVDDEPLNLKLIDAYLDGLPFVLIKSHSADEALQLLDGNLSIDLILVDRMMPDMDGTELCLKIKENPKLASIPIIMQSASAEESKITEGLKCGIIHYITKPFDQETLLNAISESIQIVK